MLSLIRIRNYAVIDELELEFGSGLSVLTGETGAGKSILVDALGLALGDRADANTVRKGKKRAEICVTFDCPDSHPALAWLSQHELDEEQTCMIRRTISAEGRSRAFINNQPVTLQDLRNLGASLVEIHGQHAHQSLLQKTNQRRILDFHGKHQPLLKSVSQLFKSWQKLKTELDDSRRGIENREEQLELLRNQEKTLLALSLEDGEVNQLQKEHGRVANTENLATGINQSFEKLYEGEMESAHTLITSSQHILRPLAELDPELKENLALLDSVEIDIREIATGLSRYRDQLNMDPQRLEWIEARIAKIRELARRYKVEEVQLETLLAIVTERIQEI
ncbi:MAG: AAA family ATPase, partial [Pseudomonadota bacterium]|nr:AAA family ATPase [Pseudomonadota bacterium]